MSAAALEPGLRQRVEEVLAALPSRHFIAGTWTPPAGGRMLESFDPGTGRVFHAFAAGDADDVGLAVETAHRALEGAWSRMERGGVLARAAELIRREAGRLAIAECLDSGKPLQEAEADVEGAARCFDYYAGIPDKFEGRTIPLGPDHLAYTSWE